MILNNLLVLESCCSSLKFDVSFLPIIWDCLQEKINDIVASKKNILNLYIRARIGRADWIRTSDPYVPNVVRYRAALLPDLFTIALAKVKKSAIIKIVRLR